jgi:hypothetical protein
MHQAGDKRGHVVEVARVQVAQAGLMTAGERSCGGNPSVATVELRLGDGGATLNIHGASCGGGQYC